MSVWVFYLYSCFLPQTTSMHISLIRDSKLWWEWLVCGLWWAADLGRVYFCLSTAHDPDQEEAIIKGKCPCRYSYHEAASYQVVRAQTIAMHSWRIGKRYRKSEWCSCKNNKGINDQWESSISTGILLIRVVQCVFCFQRNMGHLTSSWPMSKWYISAGEDRPPGKLQCWRRGLQFSAHCSARLSKLKQTIQHFSTKTQNYTQTQPQVWQNTQSHAHSRLCVHFRFLIHIFLGSQLLSSTYRTWVITSANI